MNDRLEPIVESLQSLVSRFAEVAREPGVRSSVKRLAHGVLELLDATDPPIADDHEVQRTEPEPAPPTEIELPEITDAEITAPEPPPTIQKPSEPVLPASVAIRMLSLGTAGQSVEPISQTVRQEASERLADLDSLQVASDADDLALIIGRCRLKAEATRWVAERRGLIATGSDMETEVEPRTRDIIARAQQLPDCFLWMMHPADPTMTLLRQARVLSNHYDMLADVLGLFASAMTSPAVTDHEIQSVLGLVAQTQSALRQIVDRAGCHYDFDQVAVHKWLCSETNRRSIHLHRYMRADDPADPNQGDQLADQIQTTGANVRQAVGRQKRERKLLSKVQYEAGRIQQDPAELLQRGTTLLKATQELVQSGMPPSQVELRDCWLPIHHRFDEMEELPDEVLWVLREVECHLSRHPADEAPAALQSEPGDEVVELRELVGGKSMVMIGGERRPLRQKAIQDAFELDELIWNTADKHTPLDQFFPSIGRPDVVVVLLSIRWSSHSYSDLADFCQQRGKWFVRLPAGNNANQIAHQTLLQVGDRLRQSVSQ